MARNTLRTTMISAALFSSLVPVFSAASDARADATGVRRNDTAPELMSSGYLPSHSSPYLVSASTRGSCREAMATKAAIPRHADDARWACRSDDRTAFITVSAASNADAVARFSEPEWQDVQAVQLATLAPRLQGGGLKEHGGR